MNPRLTPAQIDDIFAAAERVDVPAAAPPSGSQVVVPRAEYDEALLTRTTERTRIRVPDVTFTRVHGDDAARGAAYQRAAIALLPFGSLAASRELLEAMATGTAIVATDVGAVREYVDCAAVLVAPDDPRALAAAVERVLSDRELAAELGRRARERALQFDLATAAARHLAVYRWCTRTPARTEEVSWGR